MDEDLDMTLGHFALSRVGYEEAKLGLGVHALVCTNAKQGVGQPAIGLRL